MPTGDALRGYHAAMAGYSGTPLAKKLGIKEGARLVLFGAPPAFCEEALPDLPSGVELAEPSPGATDVALLFVTSFAELRAHVAEARGWMTPAGGLWIAWPKKASGVPTDLNENLIRDIGLAEGMVDNKVCAIDETWSGLRFVFRLKDRPSRNA
jgi:hypothetical protein